jgi:peroxiredoxin
MQLIKLLGLLTSGIFYCVTLSAAQETIPAVGETFPEIALSAPTDADHQIYLGLDGLGTFSLSQVKADALVVEIFSMYCPHCQREAPTLNAFFDKLESDPRLKGRVKLIGIGAGNSDFEVDHFRKTYQVPFPLFADADFVIHKKLGEVRTPYFFGVYLTSEKRGKIFYSALGGASDAGLLLEKLTENIEF